MDKTKTEALAEKIIAAVTRHGTHLNFFKIARGRKPKNIRKDFKKLKNSGYQYSGSIAGFDHFVKSGCPKTF